jgi:endonuclease-3 related protein
MTILSDIYQILYRAFGPQHWWPGDTPFEIAVGAILTQNTNWGNVEKAIRNLKAHNVLSSKALHEIPAKKLAAMIRPAGYFNVKSTRLKAFITFLIHTYQGSMSPMKNEDTDILREKLLAVNGIGPETADSILLYALEKPVFVIDAYTKRVLSRHGIAEHDKSYEAFQDLFHSSLEKNIQMFNEFHALLVKVGKVYCKRKKPLCDRCPLQTFFNRKI